MQNSVLYIFYYKLKLFGVTRSMRHKHKWLNKIVWLNFLKKLNLTQNCFQKQHNKYSYQICLWLIVHHQHMQSIFYKGTSHWWFIGKIDNFIWKLSWYLSDLLFFFLLSDINIWYCFLLFVVIVIVAAFHFLIVLVPYDESVNGTFYLYHH